MMKNYLKLGLACSLVLATNIDPMNKYSLQAATIKQPQLSEENKVNPNHYSYEGRKGRSGRDGRDGEFGSNGQDQKITIDGSSINLNLSGTDGRDGEFGREGSDARCGSVNLDGKSEITLANGGQGGDGGKGGDGGNGGSLTVVYSQLEHLKQVNVSSSGGRGGFGAEGARGGRGCFCPTQIFGLLNTKLSYQKSDRKRIICHNGRDGKYGRNGKNGRDGQDGTLFLVKQGQDLRPDRPDGTISLSSITQNIPINLSNNVWQSRNGAVGLLSPGSLISDTYQEFVERVEKTVVPMWKESRPISDFEDREIGLELTEKDEILVTYPEDVWLDTTISNQATKTLLTIDRAVAEEETTRLTRGLISGDRSNLTFTVIDQAKRSDILNTQFKIKYRTSGDRFSDDRRGGSYKTRYEGIIPASAVTRDRQRFSLILGQLPIDSKYLHPGTKVEIELNIIRSLGSNSAEQTVDWEGEISDR